ncbi:Protein SnodProt1 [Grifola frondosa]|uniref:Protein SnodProt1 n=1 Tax=Grifola frondosa TaxID=5627 RepID=A0A1C7M5G0_GRIFR|nr:Protein SnodProt1 [Grifola frondosa]
MLMTQVSTARPPLFQRPQQHKRRRERFSAVLASLLCAAPAVLSAPTAAQTVQVTYDQTYDVASNSLAIVACSNGANGLLTKGTIHYLRVAPDFPFIGGAQAVAGWNSPNCGTCWQLQYGNTTINVLAVDHAGSGFNIGLDAMNKLTNNHAVELGVVQVASKQVAASVCGL